MRVFVALLVLLALLPARVLAGEYAIAPRPAWVLDTQPGAATPAHLKQAVEGVSYLLVDDQVLATQVARTRFHRYVSRALNAKGVESIANISIDFDPSWQQLQLHSIDVVRDGRVIPKLAGARIEVLQQEKELDELIYNGARTVKVFLDDIRVGDTLDYSYSTSGRNPVFGGTEFGATDLQWGVPVARMQARLLVPATLPLKVVTRNAAPRPTLSEHEGLRDYRWEMRDTPALNVEAGAPDWYLPFGEAEWSQFPDWAAVSRWAQPLYRVPASLSPALEAEVRRIARAEPTPTGRMLAALRFVQHEVRYLGVETGRNSHAPNPPDLVFARRFGDCKDKALLTLSLLARLGVEAHAALVNTEMRRGVADRLPNPAAFDHVIVQARVGGKLYWLDPTRPTQESDAAHLYQPDFGLSLVVAPQTTALASMKGEGSRSRRSVHVVYDARGEFSKPVRFSVVTVYEGEAAESERDSLSGTTLEAVQRNYLQFYASSYPRISVAAPISVLDDKLHNRVTTTESYSISEIASRPDKDGKHTVWIETPDVDDLLKEPEATIRKAPLELNYPLDVSQTTEVLLPSDWSIEPSDTKIEDAAFSFRRSVRPDASRKRFVIQDDYRTLSDEVAAQEMPRYTANLAKARGELGYSLSWSDAFPPPPAAGPVAGALDRMNWAIALLALFALAAFGWLAHLLWRLDPAPRGEVVPGLAGIQGWLLLYTLSVLVTPARIFKDLFGMLGSFSAERWGALTTYGTAHYHAVWAPILLFELLGNLFLLAGSLLLLALYFRRRSSFPRLQLVFYALCLLFQLVDLAAAQLLPSASVSADELRALAQYAIGASIWSAYLYSSRRVRSTFVRRLGEKAPASYDAAEDLRRRQEVPCQPVNSARAGSCTARAVASGH